MSRKDKVIEDEEPTEKEQVEEPTMQVAYLTEQQMILFKLEKIEQAIEKILNKD